MTKRERRHLLGLACCEYCVNPLGGIEICGAMIHQNLMDGQMKIDIIYSLFF